MNGQPQDITKDILLAVTNVFCAMLFDSRYDMDDPEFARLVEVDSVTHVYQWICGRRFSMAEIFSIQFYPYPERDVP